MSGRFHDTAMATLGGGEWWHVFRGFSFRSNNCRWRSRHMILKFNSWSSFGCQSILACGAFDAAFSSRWINNQSIQPTNSTSNQLPRMKVRWKYVQFWGKCILEDRSGCSTNAHNAKRYHVRKSFPVRKGYPVRKKFSSEKGSSSEKNLSRDKNYPVRKSYPGRKSTSR